MKYISYWMLPVVSGCMWLATLLGLLLWWIVAADRPILASMQKAEDGVTPTQTIAYISDAGATDRLKPLFVAGCIVTTLFLDLTFVADRWLRHRGRLQPNVSTAEKVLSGLTIASAALGTVGLTCLSGFDTLRYRVLHNIFLLCFMLGYVLSAIFICAEYQRLGKKYRQHRALRRSFWVKLVFAVVEVGLAVGFGVCNFLADYDTAAILEWVIAFIFSLYVFSFVVDLAPATGSVDGAFDLRPMNTLEAAEAGGARRTQDTERTLTNGNGNGAAPKARTGLRDF